MNKKLVISSGVINIIVAALFLGSGAMLAKLLYTLFAKLQSFRGLDFLAVLAVPFLVFGTLILISIGTVFTAITIKAFIALKKNNTAKLTESLTLCMIFARIIPSIAISVFLSLIGEMLFYSNGGDYKLILYSLIPFVPAAINFILNFTALRNIKRNSAPKATEADKPI